MDIQNSGLTRERCLLKLRKRRLLPINQIIRIILILTLSVILNKNTISSPITNRSKSFVVVIDPGHGGKDPGAISKGIQEKDVVLSIGLKLGKYINENYPDVKVIYTRNTDVFVPLIDRSRIANKNKADLFISLHANTCGTSSTGGTETFVLGLHKTNENLDVAKKENSVILLEDNYKSTYENFDPNSSESYIMFELVQDNYLDQSLSFADDIQRQFRNRLDNPNRGVKQAGFLVLRQSSMPSVLVETGFVSNQSDANKLKSDDGQLVIAHSIFEAFKRFRAKNNGTSISQKAIVEDKPREDTSKQAELSINKPEKPEAEDNQSSAIGTKDSVNESVKTEMPQTSSKSATSEKQETNSYYSIQIGASTSSVEPIAANFKGIKNVRREKTDKYYRYYVGKEDSIEKITPLLNQLKVKFPQAFIVNFTDNKRTIINSGPK